MNIPSLIFPYAGPGLRAAGALVLPPVCALCGTEPLPDDSICAACDEAIDRLALGPDACCSRCASPVGDHLGGTGRRRCAWCRGRRLVFTHAVALAPYAGVVRAQVHALKYRGRFALARPLARRLAARLRATAGLPALSAVAWAPAHWTRRLARGYNQAEMLARELARTLDLPTLPRGGLRRVRRTPPLLDLGARERAELLEGCVSASPAAAAALSERPGVLLVDDVMTSGATLTGCARALRAAGARAVVAAVVARRQTPLSPFPTRTIR